MFHGSLIVVDAGQVETTGTPQDGPGLGQLLFVSSHQVREVVLDARDTTGQAMLQVSLIVVDAGDGPGPSKLHFGRHRVAIKQGAWGWPDTSSLRPHQNVMDKRRR